MILEEVVICTSILNSMEFSMMLGRELMSFTTRTVWKSRAGRSFVNRGPCEGKRVFSILKRGSQSGPRGSPFGDAFLRLDASSDGPTGQTAFSGTLLRGEAFQCHVANCDWIKPVPIISREAVYEMVYTCTLGSSLSEKATGN